MRLGACGLGQGCEQTAENRAWGDDPGHRKSPPSWGYGTWRAGERNCLANTSTAGSHVGKETSGSAQAPFHPTASWSMQAGGGGWGEGGGGPADSPTEPQELGLGHHPHPQILTQEAAAPSGQEEGASGRPRGLNPALGWASFSPCGIF